MYGSDAVVSGLWTVDFSTFGTRHRVPYILPIHQFLYLFRLNGNVSHQVEVAVFLNDKIVFQADAYAFFRDIDPRFDCKHHSRNNWLVHGTHIMHVQTQMVRSTVHKVFFVQWMGGILLADLVFIQEP